MITTNEPHNCVKAIADALNAYDILSVAVSKALESWEPEIRTKFAEEWNVLGRSIYALHEMKSIGS